MFKKLILIVLFVLFMGGGAIDSANGPKYIIINALPVRFNVKDFEKYIIQKNPRVNRILVPEIARSIISDARLRAIDPLTVMAVTGVESTFFKNAKGGAGEIGLMQITPRYWVHDSGNRHNLIAIGLIKPITDKNPHPENELWLIQKNISAGTHILAVKRDGCVLWERADRLKKLGFQTINECMIRRYNGGNPRKTREYYKKVTAMIGDYYYFAQHNGFRVPNLVAMR